MKKNFLFLFVIIFLVFNLYPSQGNATVWVINVQSFNFTPSSLPDVHVGDTVRWVWVNGNHTTTSTTIPEGASSWDHPMNSTSTQFDYIPEITGTYDYKCTFHEAMGMIGSFTVMSGVGIAKTQMDLQVQISPNPFINNLTIRFSEGTNYRIQEIHFYDLSGKLISKFLNPEINLDGSTSLSPGNLEKGIYFLEIVDETGKIYMQRVIKK